MDEQSRINAMISYFFLGPLFLLAKRGTPLREEFVHAHALRSTLIISISFITILCYSLLLSDHIDFSLLGISLDTVVYTILSLVTIGYLLRGAYSAYRGLSVEYQHIYTPNLDYVSESNITIEQDEDRIRLIASMIPFLGIYIARLYPHPLIIRGRVFGSLLASLIIIASVFSGSGGFLSGFILVGSILIFLIIAVNLFIHGKLLFSGVIEKVPTYEELESHIFASVRSIGEFSRIAFGGKEKKGYEVFFRDELTHHMSGGTPKNAYFMPSGLIALPVWNLLCIPSLWIEEYREYREYILSGIAVTLISGLTIYFQGGNEPLLLFLLFPLVHMLSYSRTDLAKSIPIFHVITRLSRVFGTTQEKIRDESQKTEEIHFQYTTETSDPGKGK